MENVKVVVVVVGGGGGIIYRNTNDNEICTRQESEKHEIRHLVSYKIARIFIYYSKYSVLSGLFF